MSPLRAALLFLLTALALAGLAAPAGAVLSGENGRIVFISGRVAGDATAGVYFLPVPFSTGGGTLSPLISPPASGQYRHPTWSPDRTKIAYANGTQDNNPVTQNFDIYVQDIAAGTGPVPVTNTGDSLSADRPAWSPDGTRIMYEHQPVDASADRILRVQSALDLALPITTTDVTPAGAPAEGKPAWTPDSSAVFYSVVDGGDLDISRKPPTAGGTVTPVLTNNGSDEYQPSVSPDGSKLCFTQQATPGSLATANVMVAASSNPGSFITIAAQAASEYNCTWSPDGTKIAYATGAFSAGALEMNESNGLGGAPIPLAQDPGGDDFDGNPDWAPDGRPTCPDSTVSTPVNTPITIELECTDTGPAYEQTDPNGFIANDGGPANGTTSDDVPLANPSTVKYTPNQNFTGTDAIEFGSFDFFGFGSDKGTVTINVQPAAGGGGGGGGGVAKPKCGGKTATIVGTAANNTLVGTTGPDVIAGLGGNDTIRGGRGKDVICGGTGRDRIGGGSGNDRAAGGSGNDRVSGNSGRDSLKGESGRDRLSGGSGRDRLNGGSGRDRLNGGSARDRCNGGASRDRGASCERSSSIP